MKKIGKGAKGDIGEYLGKSIRNAGYGRNAGTGIQHQHYTKAVDQYGEEQGKFSTQDRDMTDGRYRWFDGHNRFLQRFDFSVLTVLHEKENSKNNNRNYIINHANDNANNNNIYVNGHRK